MNRTLTDPPPLSSASVFGCSYLICNFTTLDVSLSKQYCRVYLACSARWGFRKKSNNGKVFPAGQEKRNLRGTSGLPPDAVCRRFFFLHLLFYLSASLCPRIFPALPLHRFLRFSFDYFAPFSSSDLASELFVLLLLSSIYVCRMRVPLEVYAREQCHYRTS